MGTLSPAGTYLDDDPPSLNHYRIIMRQKLTNVRGSRDRLSGAIKPVKKQGRTIGSDFQFNARRNQPNNALDKATSFISQ